MSALSVGAIVAAAGRGERLGAALPKALLPLAGRSLVARAAHMLSTVAPATSIVVAAPPDLLAEMHAALDPVVPGVVIVAGGADRQESVRRALAALPNDVDIVVVHDAARALAPAELADDVIAAVRAGADAAVPVLPLADTVKEVDAAGLVVRTLDRATLRAVQTPQAFRRTVLESVHAQAAVAVTDDAALVEAAGGRVVTVPGSPRALKVTTAADVAVAELWLTDVVTSL